MITICIICYLLDYFEYYQRPNSNPKKREAKTRPEYTPHLKMQINNWKLTGIFLKELTK